MHTCLSILVVCLHSCTSCLSLSLYRSHATPHRGRSVIPPLCSQFHHHHHQHGDTHTHAYLDSREAHCHDSSNKERLITQLRQHRHEERLRCAGVHQLHRETISSTHLLPPPLPSPPTFTLSHSHTPLPSSLTLSRTHTRSIAHTTTLTLSHSLSLSLSG